MPETLPPPGDQVAKLQRRMDAQDRKIQTLETALRAAYTTIGQGGLTVNKGGNVRIEDGGGLVIDGTGRIDIEDGGSIIVRDFESRTVMYAGGISGGGFGFFVERLNGSRAISLHDDDPADEAIQRLRFRDKDSESLLVEDSAGGAAWPLLPLHPWRADSRTWSGTAAGVFTILAGARGQKHSPRLYAEVLHTVTAADTTAELRLRCNGVQIGSTLTSIGTAVGTASFGPADVAGTIGSGLDLTVEARVTGGTGEVLAELKYSNAWPS